MVTVVVTFQAKPGRSDDLVAWLRQNQAHVRAFKGFRSIELLRDERGIVEIETWDSADSHRAMVDATDWAPLDAVVSEEPGVRYLSPV